MEKNEALQEQIRELKDQKSKRKPIYMINDREIDDLNMFKTDLDRRFVNLQRHIEQLNNDIKDLSQSGAQPIRQSGPEEDPYGKTKDINEEIKWRNMVDRENDFIIQPLEPNEISDIQLKIELDLESQHSVQKAQDQNTQTQKALEPVEPVEPVNPIEPNQTEQAQNPDQTDQPQQSSQPVQEQLPEKIVQYSVDKGFEEEEKKMDDIPQIQSQKEDESKEMQLLLQDEELKMKFDQVKARMFKDRTERRENTVEPQTQKPTRSKETPQLPQRGSRTSSQYFPKSSNVARQSSKNQQPTVKGSKKQL